MSDQYDSQDIPIVKAFIDAEYSTLKAQRDELLKKLEKANVLIWGWGWPIKTKESPATASDAIEKNKDINKVIAASLSVRGKEWQLLKLAEECSELSAAILQFITKGASEDKIQREAADVEIALSILSLIYGRKNMDQYVNEKIVEIAGATIKRGFNI